jgi:hypothetical protein
MTSVPIDALDHRLAVPCAPGTFSSSELDGCDEPVRRYFRAAVAAGTPAARAARIRMRGSIKFGKRWVPFHARELLAPSHGYAWPATVAGGLLRGYDDFVGGEASMSWKLMGLVSIIRVAGPDVARSAAGRAAAESIWVPTALLPRYGVHWRTEDDHRIVAAFSVVDEQVSVEIAIDDAGLVRSIHLDRWGDPDGTGRFDWCPFGIEVAASRKFPCGITMPAQGAGGWFHQTDAWQQGAFMRYSISDLIPV